jgi:hypothetical protein
MQRVGEAGVDLEQRLGCPFDRLIWRLGRRAQRRADDPDRVHGARVEFGQLATSLARDAVPQLLRVSVRRPERIIVVVGRSPRMG